MVAAIAMLAIGQAAIGTAQASTVVNVNPSSPSGGNSFPFGQGNIWPQLGFVYKNVPAFNLKTGDTIAFDLGAMNDVNIQLQIDMAPTTVNGGDVPGAYTTVVPNTQVPANPKGDAVAGDYELQFTATAPFNFPGGGLIIRFSNPGGAFASDTSGTTTLFNLASSSDPSGRFVERFYNDADGLPSYDNSSPDHVAGFRLTLADVPPPATPAPPGTTPASTITGLRAAALKKCKKKHGRARANCKKKANKLPV
jgi:hypothetical protein